MPHQLLRTPSARLLLVAAALVAGAFPAPAEPLGALAEPDRLVVRGLTSIDPQCLRRPLLADDELVWLTRPSASRAAYLAALARKAEQTLRRAGFPAATVGAAVEEILGRPHAVLTVTEGPRAQAGAITVTGLADDVAARLKAFLNAPAPPADALPPASDEDAPAGAPAARWLDPDGRPAILEAPVWPAAGPAPCDEATLRRARAAVIRFLRDEGHLGLEPPAARRSAAASVWSLAFGGKPAGDGPVGVQIDAADGTATLAVTVRALPPQVRLRRVEVLPGAATKHDELARFLGITIGGPVTDRDRLAWSRRLRRSGRFLRHSVELRVDPIDPTAVVARFELDEYPPLLPLSRTLSREEETLLRGRDWLTAALAGDTDLVCDLALSTAEAVPGTPAPHARLVIAGTTGFALAAPAEGADACGLVVVDDMVSVLPPGGDGRFDIPLPLAGRTTASIALTLDRAKPGAGGAPPPRPFTRNLAVGMGFSAGGHTARPGFGLDLHLEPVAWLSLLHEGKPTVRWDGDEMVVTDDDGHVLRFDGPTGRPLSVVTPQARLVIAARPGALAADAERLTAAAGPNRADATRPLSTAVAFLVSEDVAAACHRLVDTFGIAGTARADWEQTARVVAAAARKCLDDEALARCDRQLADWIAGLTTTADDDDLVVPPGEPAAAGQPAVTRQAAALAWRLSERAWGRDAWPTALVRAGACAAVGSPAVLEEVTLFMGAKEHGPIAHAVAATLCPMPPLAATLARRGQERLSMVAFHTDCYPLTAVLGPAGLEDVLVSVLRGIDDEATRDLGVALAGDETLLVPLVERLRAFPSHRDALVGLQQSLDAWWLSSLKDVVARRLAVIATPHTAAAPPAEEPVTK